MHAPASRSGKRKRVCLSRMAALIGVAAALGLGGCAPASQAIEARAQSPTVPLDPAGEVVLDAQAHQPVGEVLPVEVTIVNYGGKREFAASGLQAIDDAGARVTPLERSEAIARSGDAEALRHMLSGRHVVMAVVAPLFRDWAIGTAIGMQFCRPGEPNACGGGIILGSGLGLGVGIVHSVIFALSAETRLGELLLRPSTLEGGEHAQGYIFLPNGKYTGLELTMINTETGRSESLLIPWKSDDLAQGSTAAGTKVASK